MRHDSERPLSVNETQLPPARPDLFWGPPPGAFWQPKPSPQPSGIAAIVTVAASVIVTLIAFTTHLVDTLSDHPLSLFGHDFLVIPVLGTLIASPILIVGLALGYVARLQHSGRRLGNIALFVGGAFAIQHLAFYALVVIYTPILLGSL